MGTQVFRIGQSAWRKERLSDITLCAWHYAPYN
jgi:hypothetical protein